MRGLEWELASERLHACAVVLQWCRGRCVVRIMAWAYHSMEMVVMRWVVCGGARGTCSRVWCCNTREVGVVLREGRVWWCRSSAWPYLMQAHPTMCARRNNSVSEAQGSADQNTQPGNVHGLPRMSRRTR